MTDPHHQPEGDPPPPLFGSWRNLYWLLLGELVLLVAGFYALSRWAS